MQALHDAEGSAYGLDEPEYAAYLRELLQSASAVRPAPGFGSGPGGGPRRRGRRVGGGGAGGGGAGGGAGTSGSGGRSGGLQGVAAAPLPAGRLNVEGLLLLLPPDGRSVRELGGAATPAASAGVDAANSGSAGGQAEASADPINSALVRVREPRLQFVGVAEGVALLGLPSHAIRCEHLFRLPATPSTTSDTNGATLAATPPVGAARSDAQVREAMRALWRRLCDTVSQVVQPPATFEWIEADGSICARSLRLVADRAIEKLRCTFEHRDEALVVACLPLLRAR